MINKSEQPQERKPSEQRGDRSKGYTRRRWADIELDEPPTEDIWMTPQQAATETDTVSIERTGFTAPSMYTSSWQLLLLSEADRIFHLTMQEQLGVEPSSLHFKKGTTCLTR